MPRVPNELIEAIVREVEDVPSLKACSIAASAFQSPCQRILLRSLTLKAAPANFIAAQSFLDESPHVATYITTLYIWPPTPTTPTSEIESFVEILNRFENVRLCTLIGTKPRRPDSIWDRHDWREVTVQVSSAVFAFLARQSLHELRVRLVRNIPISSFLSLLTAAPRVGFWYVSLDTLNHPPAITPHTPTLAWLSIKYQSDSITELLARPQYAFHIETLRQLEVSVRDYDYADTHALLGSAAHTLERVQFTCHSLSTDLETPVLSPPTLPVLRCVEFTLWNHDCGAPWFKDTLMAILAPHCSPALTEAMITVNCNVALTSLRLEPGLMTTLDGALMAHPTDPCIRWRIAGKNIQLNDFVQWVQGEMARVHTKGRLLVEADV
ncbi:hypothetical protein B0H19DRAFT_1140315 [Mycena capillaripes]|nr:hypothetical protein B0H19DRAFT_1140315 [Mycena capillaripes]